VRAVVVVVEAPSLDDPPGGRQALEEMLVEAFVAEATVEALHEGVLDRLAWRDVVPFDAVVLLPAEDGVRRKFGAIVAHHHQRLASGVDKTVELAGDPTAGQRAVDHQGQALPREVVDHHQNPEAFPVGEHVGDEVQAPALVGSLRQRHRCLRPERPLAAAAPTHRQPLLLVEAEQLLVVQLDPVPAQEDQQAPVAEPPPLSCQALQPLPQRAVVRLL